MKTRVKVKRSELLKVVDGRLRKAERQLERAATAYPAAVTEWEKSVVTKLEKALADAKRGKMPDTNYRNAIPLPDKPLQPSKNGRELCNLRRLAKTLQMGADETILLSQEDADAYFGPCAT